MNIAEKTIIVVFITLAMVLTKDRKTNSNAKITIENQREIVSKIGVNGYKKAEEVNCLNDIVSKMNGNEWSDEFCANSYRHLEF